MILGIDISSSAIGVAVLKGNNRVQYQGKIIPKGESPGKFYNRLRKELAAIMNSHPIENIVIEDLNIRFLASGKKILPIHGVVKELAYAALGKEPVTYNVSTYRFTILGLKRYKKTEKEAAKKVAKTKAEYKRMTDIKNKVIAYINSRLKLKLTYEDNDIADALALCVAHYDVSHGAVKLKLKPRKKNVKRKAKKSSTDSGTK